MAIYSEIIPSINIIRHEKKISKVLTAVRPFGITKSSEVTPNINNNLIVIKNIKYRNEQKEVIIAITNANLRGTSVKEKKPSKANKNEL